MTYPMKQFRCPNGMRFWNAPESGTETNFIYKEIFESRCYEKHGISISDGDVVFDVGANVGIFACSLLKRFHHLKLYCFEPVPNTRACLERNIAECSVPEDQDVTILDVALGARECQATMDFFPSAPGNSTLYSERKKQEFEAIAEEVRIADIWKLNRIAAVAMLLLYPFTRRLIRKEFRQILAKVEPVVCTVRTLSRVLEELGVERIDLLKVDVEGAELDVLEGIEERHWPLIRQLVLEVAPANKPQLDALTKRLHSLGFTKVVVEHMLGNSQETRTFEPCNLYALRETNSTH